MNSIKSTEALVDIPACFLITLFKLQCILRAVLTKVMRVDSKYSCHTSLQR